MSRVEVVGRAPHGEVVRRQDRVRVRRAHRRRRVRRGAGVGPAMRTFADEFRTDQREVLHPGGLELRREVRLQRERLLRAAARLALAIEHGVVRQDGRAAGQPRCDGPEIALVVGVTHDRPELRVRAEAMRPRGCRDARVVPVVVGIGHAVEAVRRHGDRPAVEVRHAEVRDIALLQLVVREGHLVRRADAEGHGGRDAPAFLRDGVAEAVRVRLHRVDPECRRLADLLVHVGEDALVAVAAERERCGAALAERRHLADLVDEAARRAATVEHRRGSAQHLDPVEIERLAVVLRDVAHVVEVEIADGRVAAQRDVVADPAAFAGIEGEARDVAQGVLHGVGTAVLHELARHGRQRLRDVACRQWQLARGRDAALVGLVGRADAPVDLHGRGGQLGILLLPAVVGLLARRGLGERGAAHAEGEHGGGAQSGLRRCSGVHRSSPGDGLQETAQRAVSPVRRGEAGCDFIVMRIIRITTDVNVARRPPLREGSRRHRGGGPRGRIARGRCLAPRGGVQPGDRPSPASSTVRPSRMW